MHPLIKKYLINFYVIFASLFAVWIIFLDANDVGSVLKKRARNRKLAREIVYYKERIKQVQLDHKSLQSDLKEVERFGRENYNMKRGKEDLYIIYKGDED